MLSTVKILTPGIIALALPNFYGIAILLVMWKYLKFKENINNCSKTKLRLLSNA
jgi:hypothetical protein